MSNSKLTNRDTLKDIRSVRIDASKPPSERVKAFVEQIGNPYCYLDSGVVVEVGFADTDISLQDRLLAYVSSIDVTTVK